MNARIKILARLSLASIALACLGIAATALHTPSDDFVTGGGWIEGTPSAERANFGFKAGVDVDGGFFGRLRYIDHETKMQVRSESITAYIVVNPTTRRFEGTATLDHTTLVTFVVVVADAGQPGTSDSFSLTLSTGYSASGTLQGGNIRLRSS